MAAGIYLVVSGVEDEESRFIRFVMVAGCWFFNFCSKNQCALNAHDISEKGRLGKVMCFNHQPPKSNMLITTDRQEVACMRPMLFCMLISIWSRNTCCNSRVRVEHAKFGVAQAKRYAIYAQKYYLKM